MNIKVLGKGCSKCELLEAHVKEALKELDLNIEVEKVKNINDIIEYGVMKTPALVINDKAVVVGRIPLVKEIVELLKNAE